MGVSEGELLCCQSRRNLVDYCMHWQHNISEALFSLQAKMLLMLDAVHAVKDAVKDVVAVWIVDCAVVRGG